MVYVCVWFNDTHSKERQDEKLTFTYVTYVLTSVHTTFLLGATDVFAKGFYVVRELPYVEIHTKVNSAHILPTNCSFTLIFFNNKCIQLLY